jgi:hypothetical protein
VPAPTKAIKSRLEVGGLIIFNADAGPYSWEGNAARQSIDDFLDVPTSAEVLNQRHCIATASLGHIIEAHGNSHRWGAEVLNLEIVGNHPGPKSLRVHFRVTTDGDPTAAVQVVHLSGFILSGKAVQLLEG